VDVVQITVAGRLDFMLRIRERRVWQERSLATVRKAALLSTPFNREGKQ
jgi:hypothetical protein